MSYEKIWTNKFFSGGMMIHLNVFIVLLLLVLGTRAIASECSWELLVSETGKKSKTIKLNSTESEKIKFLDYDCKVTATNNTFDGDDKKRVLGEFREIVCVQKGVEISHPHFCYTFNPSFGLGTHTSELKIKSLTGSKEMFLGLKYEKSNGKK